MQKFYHEGEYFSHIITQREIKGIVPAQDKPVVKYMALPVKNTVAAPYQPKVGSRYNMVPVDHPAEYLNGRICESSRVISVDDNNTSFETQNTRYELAE